MRETLYGQRVNRLFVKDAIWTSQNYVMFAKDCDFVSGFNLNNYFDNMFSVYYGVLFMTLLKVMDKKFPVCFTSPGGGGEALIVLFIILFH